MTGGPARAGSSPRTWAVSIRRHQVLVNCAFSFCWAAWFAHPAPQDTTPPAPQADSGERGPRTRQPATVLAPRDPGRARMAGPVDHAAALVDRLVDSAPARPAASSDQLGRGRPRPPPLQPEVTHCRYFPGAALTQTTSS